MKINKNIIKELTEYLNEFNKRFPSQVQTLEGRGIYKEMIKNGIFKDNSLFLAKLSLMFFFI